MPDRLLNFSDPPKHRFRTEMPLEPFTLIFANVNGNFASDADRYAPVKSILRSNINNNNNNNNTYIAPISILLFLSVLKKKVYMHEPTKKRVVKG